MLYLKISSRDRSLIRIELVSKTPQSETVQEVREVTPERVPEEILHLMTITNNLEVLVS